MTFVEAIKTGRPMRRKSASIVPEWIVLGYDGSNDVVGIPRWRETRSGKLIGLRFSDYTAEDWEVLA
jgi:hypothetical protein